MWSRWDWNIPTGIVATKYFSSEVIHLRICCVVSPVTHCVGWQSTLLLSLLLVSLWLCVCQQWALVTLRHSFHRGINADPLKPDPRTAVFTPLDTLWELWWQLKLWPGPIPMCNCPQVQFSHSVMSNSLQPHVLKHTKLPCPSPAPTKLLPTKPTAKTFPSFWSTCCTFGSFTGTKLREPSVEVKSHGSQIHKERFSFFSP